MESNPRITKWGVAKFLGKGALWLLALLLTALATQEITKRYANRQQADELRSRVTTMVSRASVLTYNEAFDVVYRQYVGKRGDYAAQRNRVTAGWTVASAEIDPLLFVHFEESAARRHWKDYQDAVYALAELSYVDPWIDPVEVTEPIRSYLPKKPDETFPTVEEAERDPWPILHCREKGCSQTIDWLGAYRDLGLWILKHRGSLANDIAKAEAGNLGD